MLGRVQGLHGRVGELGSHTALILYDVLVVAGVLVVARTHRVHVSCHVYSVVLVRAAEEDHNMYRRNRGGRV